MSPKSKARPLSVGRALEDGFGLLASRPGAAVVWGVVYLVLAYGPILLLAPGYFAAYAAFLGAFGESAEALESAALSLSRSAPLADVASTLGALLALAVVPTAIYRTMLRPKEAGRFGLRLGPTEGMQALVWVTWYVTSLGIMLVALLLAAVVWFLAYFAGTTAQFDWSAPPGGALAGSGLFALMIFVLVALFWGMLRLSMGALISFDKGGFRLFDSWKLTRGRVWRLFALTLVLYLFMILVALAVFALCVGGALIAGAADFAAVERWFERPESPWIAGAVAVILGGAVMGPLYAVCTGAWTSAYRQLSPAGEAAPPQES